MHSINLDVPFMVLSTKVNGSGETEKRFFTPFGAIDVTLRRPPGVKRQEQHLEIEVCGDAQYWACYEVLVKEFRSTLLSLVWGMIFRDHLEGGVSMDFSRVTITMKGSEIALTRQSENDDLTT